MEIGDDVEVRVAYTGAWAAGFEIAEVVDGGYRVRRHSDGSMLPNRTSAHDVRAIR